MAKKTKIEAAVTNGVLKLRLSGRIWQGDVASSFKWEIDAALAQNIKTAELYINSEGGSVFEAQEAINELKRLDKVLITIGSLAASAATMFLCHFEAQSYSTSQFMIHKPLTWASGNEDQVKAELKALTNLTNVYRSAYAKKLNITEEEVDDLWKNDYWMDAKEAKEKGLISTIIDEEIEVDETTVAMMVACGCPNVPQPTAKKSDNTNNNDTKMDINQLRAALGMSATATEQEVLNRLAENKTKAEAAAAAEASSNEQKKTNAERVVNKAILDKKITADMKETYVSLHIQDPASTEAILNGMKGVTAASENQKHTADGDLPKGRENWTIDDYLEKDPQAFNDLCETNPDLVKKMNAAYSQKK
ncbi:hypothetical protein EG349_10295 [Chryseobacterium shandongense]|uniref:ATP-dependent Clp protease proteolytic subunit n=2 Tax=Chryseobacterium TaxID=59732 RepID=A0AAD0YE90_9FLAO|nr:MULTISPECIES: ATP-dependent Clp protease proteolytic subunit [Chryseobacterium]AZA87149.1 hypothetical protein EG349_10295 [Chryseobacterium shandongense]AZA95578.1 hypothetical protein EG353_08370 [Chryseobacterium shandongense]MEC3876142.1 ATP-dependent Clp protease proteolytic subunit [Chryseobacterium sp. T9W2-O]